MPSVTVYRTGGAGERLPICKRVIGWRGSTGAICSRSPVTTGMAPGWYQVEAWIPGVDTRGNYLPDAFGRRGKRTWVVNLQSDQSFRYDLGPQVGRGVASPRAMLGSIGGMSAAGVIALGVVGYFVWSELRRAGRRGHLAANRRRRRRR